MSARLFLAVFDHPRIAWAVFAVLSLGAAFGLTRLHFDDDYLNLLRSPDRSFTALESSYEDFENEVNDLVIVVDDAAGVIRVPVLRALQMFVDALDDHPDFGRPISLLDAAGPVRFNLSSKPLVPPELAHDAPVDEIREALLRHAIVGGRLLDEHAQMMLVVVALRDEGGGRIPVSVMRQRLATARRIAEESGLATHARVRFSGPPAIRTVTVESLARDQLKFGTAAVLVALTVGLLLFRSVSTAAIVVAPAAVGVTWTFGLMGLVGEPVNLVNGTLVPLLLAIAVSDTIHLVLDFHRRLGAGAQPRAAIRETIALLGSACVLTSLTTAVGFGSLAAADISLIARLGVLCVLGVGFCLTAVVILVPRWAVSRFGIQATARVSLPRDVRPPGSLVRAWARPAPLMVGSAVLFAALLVVATNVRVDVRATTELPPESEEYQTFLDVEEAFGGLLSSHVVIHWPEGRTVASRELRTVLAEVHAALDATGVAGPPFSLLTVEAAARGRATGLDGLGSLFAFGAKSVLRRLAEPRTRSALVYARMRDAGARKLVPVLNRLRLDLDAIEERHPGYFMEQTGLMPVHVATIDRLIKTLARSLLIAVPVIFFTIAISFRSTRWALASLIPNALPLVAIAVYLVVNDWHIGIAGALSFTVALGIAVDDTIHYLERTRVNLAGGDDPLTAATRAWAALVPVMFATTAIFVASFGVLGFSSFAGVQGFGELCCLAFTVALVGDLVVLPAWLIGFARVPAGGTASGGELSGRSDGRRIRR